MEKLRLSGLVERIPHDGDRRMVVVTISEAGKNLLTDIERKLFADPKNMPGLALTDTESAELADLLDRFRE